MMKGLRNFDEIEEAKSSNIGIKLDPVLGFFPHPPSLPIYLVNYPAHQLINQPQHLLSLFTSPQPGESPRYIPFLGGDIVLVGCCFMAFVVVVIVERCNRSVRQWQVTA